MESCGVFSMSTQTSSQTDSLGVEDGTHGPAYFLTLSIVYSILAVLGLTGNSLTLLSVVTNKQLQTIPNAYVANLAVLDLGVCIMSAIAPLYKVITGETYDYCKVTGFITIYSIACSRLLLGFISVNRYVLIVKGTSIYIQLYTKPHVVITIVISYLLPLAFLLPAGVGAYSSFSYNYKMGACFFEADSRESYWYITGIIETTFFMPALFLTIIIYILIIRQFQKIRNKVKHRGSNGNTIISGDAMTCASGDNIIYPLPSPQRLKNQAKLGTTKKLFLSKERKVVLNLVTVFSVFLLCWSPLCFTLMADYYFKVPPIIYTVFMVLGTSNSALNFFIYAFMNKQFRDSYARILTCRCLTADN